jgi:hypothetical protein
VGTLTTATTTTQVRPWPAGGAWNNVTQVLSQKWAAKGTVFGVTLPPGAAQTALRALDMWMDAGGVGTSAISAQQIAHGVGLEIQESATLATGAVGNGVTTNVLDRGVSATPTGSTAQVSIVTTIGATPTATYQVEGSLDGTAWNPLSTADSGTPTVFSTGTFVITTATTTVRIVDPAAAWRFIRVTVSANTNVTSTITATLG